MSTFPKSLIAVAIVIVCAVGLALAASASVVLPSASSHMGTVEIKGHVYILEGEPLTLQNGEFLQITGLGVKGSHYTSSGNAGQIEANTVVARAQGTSREVSLTFPAFITGHGTGTLGYRHHTLANVAAVPQGMVFGPGEIVEVVNDGLITHQGVLAGAVLPKAYALGVLLER